uniref:ABC transporter permease n=1 Tax=Desulfacinum infernum TaxID=35837 RepID=A0A832A3M0_9BACT
MGAWFRIAARNLIKNKRRSLLTMLAIAFGYGAVNLFGGFTAYMYEGLREGAVYGTMRGHLTLFKEGFLEKGQLDPTAYLLSPEELQAVEAVCRCLPQVVLATPQMGFTGLISNGKVSTIFIGRGVMASALREIWTRRFLTRVQEFDGRPLDDAVPDGVAVSRGLARLVDLKLDATAVVLANTVDGLVNALDVTVAQMIDVGASALEDKVLLAPLGFARSLLDTQGADRVVLLLERYEQTETVRARLGAALKQAGLPVEIRNWIELSPEYTRTKKMFDMIFFFVFVIVFVIVVMSVVNTMSMAVMERIREIGTLRALGLKRRGVLVLFGLESLLLGLVGGVLGMGVTTLGWFWVKVAEPMWTPPTMVRPIPLKIFFVPEYLGFSWLVMVGLCLLASVVPARRAARQNVVEALGHV